VLGHHGKQSKATVNRLRKAKRKEQKQKESKKEKKKQLKQQANAKADCLERVSPAVCNELWQRDNRSRTSRFGSMAGIVELKKRGVCSSALVKKRRCWPKCAPSDAVKEHFNNKPVGSADTWGGALDEVPFCLFGVKEPDCVVMLMSAHGALERASAPKQRQLEMGQSVTISCPEAVDNHCKCHHAVNDHNNNRHQPISLEET
jgi:hypothetical protein